MESFAGRNDGLTFAKLGLLPGLGSTHLLPLLVGMAKAQELVLSARVIRAEEAAEIGLAKQGRARGVRAGRSPRAGRADSRVPPRKAGRRQARALLRRVRDHGRGDGERAIRNRRALLERVDAEYEELGLDPLDASGTRAQVDGLLRVHEEPLLAG